jgi:serine/threonine protein kinase
LADLELGVPSSFPQGSDGLTVDDFLVNWIAPEVLRGELFSQASDVYSLSLVFHEILTRAIPYEDIPAIRETPRETIKDLVDSSPLSLLHLTHGSRS